MGVVCKGCSLRVAINGFGRIGRYITYLAAQSDRVEVVLVNDPMPVRSAAYLLRHDSAHDRQMFPVEEKDDGIVINGRFVRFVSQHDPSNLPLGALDVDAVIEASGCFRTQKSLNAFLEAGAKRVVTTYPLYGFNCATLLPRINDETIPEDSIISAGTCTAHGLAPVLKVIDDNFGVRSGSMVTVHAYTSNQGIVDSAHSTELRKGRAAAGNIVPVSTVAIGVIETVMPHLHGALTGYSLRVPVLVGSFLDLTVNVSHKTSVEQVNELMRNASICKYSGVLSVRDDEPVSSDIIGSAESAVVDLAMTRVVQGNLVKVCFWYDNESGFSHRLVELAERL